MSELRPKIGVTGFSGVTGRTLKALWADQVDFYPFTGNITKSIEVGEWYRSLPLLDGLLHLAALVPVHLVEADPMKAFEVNVLGTLNLLEEVRKFSEKNKPWMFYSSTSHVYATSNEPISESTLIDPINMYGETKAQADKWCQIYSTRFGLPICTGRIFSCSSPLQSGTYFVPAMIQKVKNLPKGQTLEARGLNGTRDFLTVNQVCSAIQFLFKKRSTGIFNLASGQPIKLIDMVEAIKKRLGREDLKIVAQGAEAHHLVANVQKLAAEGLKLEFNYTKFLDCIFESQK